jgi:hypothetical protein
VCNLSVPFDQLRNSVKTAHRQLPKDHAKKLLILAGRVEVGDPEAIQVSTAETQKMRQRFVRTNERPSQWSATLGPVKGSSMILALCV